MKISTQNGGALLTVEYLDEVVEINCDAAGLDFLISRLQELRKNGGHEHFMTPAWAGDELTEQKQGAENILVHHLRVALAPPSKP